MSATTPTVRRQREEKNLKFRNDGSYESVAPMLQAFAGKCFARVQAMGLGMDFEDVHQELKLGYVLASRKWNPQGGAMFSTYCMVVCQNNFNNAIKKMEQQRAIGRIEVDEPGVELVQVGVNRKKEPIMAVKHQREFGMLSEHEMGSSEEGEYYNQLDGMVASECSDPSVRIERAQQTKVALASLSQGAKSLVQHLLKEERDGLEPSLFRAARAAKLNQAEIRRVKLEILNTFGVKWA